MEEEAMAYTYIDENGCKCTDIDRYEFCNIEYPEGINPRMIHKGTRSYDEYVAKYGDPRFVEALCDEIAKEKDDCIRNGIPFIEKPMPDFLEMQRAAGLPIPTPSTPQDYINEQLDQQRQMQEAFANAAMERGMQPQMTPYMPNTDGAYVNMTGNQEADFFRRQAQQNKRQEMFHPVAPRPMIFNNMGYNGFPQQPYYYPQQQMMYQQPPVSQYSQRTLDNPTGGYGYAKFLSPNTLAEYQKQLEQQHIQMQQQQQMMYQQPMYQQQPVMYQHLHYNSPLPQMAGVVQPSAEISGYLNGYYYPSSQYICTGYVAPLTPEQQAKQDELDAQKIPTGYTRKVTMVDTGEEIELPIYKGDYDDPTTPKQSAVDASMNEKRGVQPPYQEYNPATAYRPGYNMGYNMMNYNVSPMQYQQQQYSRAYNYAMQPQMQYYPHMGLGAKPISPNGMPIYNNMVYQNSYANPYNGRPYNSMADTEERKRMLRRKYSLIPGLSSQEIEDKVNRELDPYYDLKKMPKKELESMMEWRATVNMWRSMNNTGFDPTCPLHRQQAFINNFAADIQEKYGSHSMAEAFRHDLANMYFDELAKQNMFGSSADRYNGAIPADRDLKKTYDSKAYNDLLREHAIADAKKDIISGYGKNKSVGGLMYQLEDSDRDDEYSPSEVIGEYSHDINAEIAKRNHDIGAELAKRRSSMNFFLDGFHRLASLHEQTKENAMMQERRKAYVEKVLQSTYEDTARRKFGE